MRLYIGTGVQGFKPEGYTTIDIDPANKPDIIADAGKLPMIQNDAADEVHASHVVEHFPWPHVLLVLAEWARVIKVGGIMRIAVPDMALLARMLANETNPWHAMGSIYGGHWATPGGPQGHHYGYTHRMLIEVLTVLGFHNFKHWNTDLPEAANGWLYLDNGEQVALSINVSGIKKTAPLVDIQTLFHRIRYQDILQPFMRVVRDIAMEEIELPDQREIDSEIFQSLHMKYLNEHQRTKVLEARVAELEKRTTVAAGMQPRRLTLWLRHRLPAGGS
jgi:predicted SAM-dependent methyltransferase